jgi:hypothetical protein
LLLSLQAYTFCWFMTTSRHNIKPCSRFKITLGAFIKNAVSDRV